MPVCSRCRKEFYSLQKMTGVKRCSVCGKELYSCEEICLQCRENKILIHTDMVFPMFPYRLWNKQLMFVWKKRDVRSLSFFFAVLFYKVLTDLSIKVIVPVPPRPGKIQEKGWDQIDEICMYLKYVFGFKVFDILKRKTSSEQKKLDREKRLESIGTSYGLCKEKKMRQVMKTFRYVVPEEVCVIDDVLTTGATLESCAAILKSVGIKKVCAATLFIVD